MHTFLHITSKVTAPEPPALRQGMPTQEAFEADVEMPLFLFLFCSLPLFFGTSQLRVCSAYQASDPAPDPSALWQGMPTRRRLRRMCRCPCSFLFCSLSVSVATDQASDPAPDPSALRQGMPTQEAFEADVEMPLAHLLDHLQEKNRKLK